MSLLTNKIVFITGASSGLGAATALEMAREGADLFLAGRNQQALADIKQQAQALGAKVDTASFDVADPAACAAAVAQCVSYFGGLDALVNAAGVHRFYHATDVTPEQWRADLDTNLSGPFFLSQAAIPTLLERKGNIVNVASIAGLQGQAYSAAYCAAKHGLIGMTRSLALEYSNSDLRVNVVCPGGMDTPQVANLQIPEGIDFDLLMRSAALRGMMNPNQVASVIAFIASDKASAIHGAVYTVDQGKTVG